MRKMSLAGRWARFSKSPLPSQPSRSSPRNFSRPTSTRTFPSLGTPPAGQKPQDLRRYLRPTSLLPQTLRINKKKSKTENNYTQTPHWYQLGAVEWNYCGDLKVWWGAFSPTQLLSGFQQQSNFNKPTSTHTKLSSPHCKRMCENDPYRPPAGRSLSHQGRWGYQDVMFPIPGQLPSTRLRFPHRCRRWLWPKEKEGNTQTEFRKPVQWPAGRRLCGRRQGVQKRNPHKCSVGDAGKQGIKGFLGSAATEGYQENTCAAALWILLRAYHLQSLDWPISSSHLSVLSAGWPHHRAPLFMSRTAYRIILLGSMATAYRDGDNSAVVALLWTNATGEATTRSFPNPVATEERLTMMITPITQSVLTAGLHQ